MKLIPVKLRLLGGILFVIFVLLIACADKNTDKVDKLFAQWDSTDSPGAALAVIKDGQIIYKRGYGMANLDYNIPITPKTVLQIGSVSKQFTASCVALLVEEGKISLDDDIRIYIPEFPEYERAITIRHLIHHTSGIRNILPLMRLACLHVENVYTNQDMVELITNQRRLNFPSGEKYAYCNSGYFLLAAIVERVTGMSLGKYAEERIFRPLGMRATYIYEDRTMISKNRAIGYSPDGTHGFRMNHHFNFTLSGPGQVCSTLEELFLWDQNFYKSRIGGTNFNKLLLTRGSLNNKETIDYAFGLIIGEYRGLKTVSHGGSWAGFRAHLIRFPEHKFSVICLANLSSINPSSLCRKVADIYLADQFKEEPTEETKKPRVNPIKLSKEELEDKEGNYHDEKSDTWVTVSVEEEKLKIDISRQSFLLSPVSKKSFQSLDAPYVISLDFSLEKDKAQKAKMFMRGIERFNLVKAAKMAPLTPSKLKEYSGEYYNDELLTTYILVADEGKLVFKQSFKQRHVPKSPLKAMAEDDFTVKEMRIKFIRNKRKKITGFIIDAGRDKIEFIKK